MGKSITQKILENHLVEGKFEPGKEIAVKIDQTLTQDATGTMAYLQFEAMGMSRVKTELSVSYIDHNTIQVGFENADDHRYLQSIASKYGILLSRAGNGICHQVHLERFGKPGKTLLGSDSHTPTAGGIGMIGIGAGGLDVAVAMGGEPFYLTCPKVTRINFKGKLKPWVSAKDVVLKVLEIFTTKGNVGSVFEYGGEGVKTLSVPERATITNMGAECGVTTSVFPSDEITERFLKAQGRKNDWVEVKADEDAEYDKVVDIDLGEIVPLVAYPHSPGNIKTVKELSGMKVNQVCIGSCTNSSYKDLMTVAKILKGKKVYTAVSLVISPGSKQVIENLAKEGVLADLYSTGARITEPICGFCIGNSQSPQTEAVSIRTSNRNFFGRSGTRSANLYLTSPETAAAAVITGEMTDPRDMEMDYPQVEMPERFYTDDSMILLPSKTPEKVQIYRGPNIGEPPTNPPMPSSISGIVTIKVGDKITTDHIIPAGSRMKYRSNVPKYSEFVFEVVDDTFYKRAVKYRDEGKHNIIVGGLSYGQGSSREHAALCPMFLGVKAVLAKSFERIHSANLINFGIIPLTFKNETDYDEINSGDEIQIPNIRKVISNYEPLMVKNVTKEKDFEVNYELSERQRDILLAGGMLSYIKSKKTD
jgi:aconitate hydratase